MNESNTKALLLELTNALKPALSKKSVIGLVMANLTVLLPFVAWMSASPLLIPDYLIGAVPRVLSLEIFLRSLVLGLIVSAAATLIIGIPSICRANRAAKSDSKYYASEITLWTAIWSVVAGVYFGLAYHSIAVIPLAASITFAALCIPSYLGGLLYWYLVIREKPSKAILSLIVLLFLFWNFLSANFSSLAAA